MEPVAMDANRRHPYPRSLRIGAIATLSVGLWACGSSGESQGGEPTGTAIIALTQAPSDALCAEITAAGSRTVTRDFDLKPGASSVFSLNGLPTGNVTFSANIFGVACSQVDEYTSVPTWVTDPVPAPISSSSVTKVTLIARRNGRASVGIDFQDDAGAGGSSGSSGFTELNVPTANSQPRYLTTAPNGMVFFTETKGNKLGMADASGKITEIPLPAGTDSPQAITTDPAGDLWFGVTQGILRFQPSTQTFTLVKLSSGAEHVATAPNGNVWFSEPLVDKVGFIVGDPTAVEFGLPAGSGPDGLTVTGDGGVWVNLSGAKAIVRLDANGNITETTNFVGDRPGGGCIMVGGDGRVWASESADDEIVRIPNVIGSVGLLPDVLTLAPGSQPTGITPVGQNTWFSEFGTSKIGWVNANGGLVELPTPSPNAGPIGIITWVDANGAPKAVWIAESTANKIAIFTL